MKRPFIAALIGALFGAGLLVAGMTKTSKVVGFLDLFGRWDPSLMFVMVGAIAVHLVARRVVLRRSAPLLDEKFHLPERRDLDARLIAGAALFGVGWGLAGYCPGPALVSLGSAAWPALFFVFAMTVGIFAHRRLHAPRAHSSE